MNLIAIQTYLIPLFSLINNNNNYFRTVSKKPFVGLMLIFIKHDLLGSDKNIYASLGLL